MAGGGILVVVEVVVPNQLFAGGNVTDGEEPDAALDFIDLAVGVAGMIQIGAKALTIDDSLSIFQPVQVGSGGAVVAAIRFFLGDALAIVFNNASTLANGSRGVNADRMNWRRTYD
jgi:hypothetical protein